MASESRIARLPVSIVIPVYNDSHFLRKCLNSILKQTSLPSEVIVIDDGSDDCLCKDICEMTDYRILNIRHKKIHNVGPSGARNEGLSQVSSKFIMFLDVDDCLRKDSLLMLYNKLSELGENYFGVFGRIKNTGRFFNPKTTYITESKIYPDGIGRHGNFQGQISSYLLVTDKVRKVGGFDKLLTHYEDFKLILLLLSKSKLATIKDITLEKRHRENSLSNRNYKRSFLGALKFLSSAELNSLLSHQEVQARKKEAYLSYSKGLFKDMFLLKARVALEKAYSFSKPSCLKEEIAYYFFQLLSILFHRKKKTIKQPSVAIIIPTFNDKRYLAKTISSFKKHAVLPNELIIIDDGSEEDYVDNILESSGLLSLPLDIKKRRILNSGPSKARNIGAQMSISEYLIFLDSDDFLHKDAIFHIKRFLKINSNSIDILHCGMRRHAKVFFNSFPELKYSNENFNMIGKDNILEGLSTFVFSRKSFTELGGFDENLSHNEDFELVLRYLKKKFIIEPLFKVVPIIRKRRGSLSRSDPTRSFIGVNEFLKKASENRLLLEQEIKSRRKENHLTLAKRMFYTFRFPSFLRFAKLAFTFDPPRTLKEKTIFQFLVIIHSFSTK